MRRRRLSVVGRTVQHIFGGSTARAPIGHGPRAPSATGHAGIRLSASWLTPARGQCLAVTDPGRGIFYEKKTVPRQHSTATLTQQHSTATRSTAQPGRGSVNTPDPSPPPPYLTEVSRANKKKQSLGRIGPLFPAGRKLLAVHKRSVVMHHAGGCFPLPW